MNSDVLTAQKECLKTIDQWEGLIKRLKTVVHEQDTYAPDAFCGECRWSHARNHPAWEGLHLLGTDFSPVENRS